MIPWLTTSTYRFERGFIKTFASSCHYPLESIENIAFSTYSRVIISVLSEMNKNCNPFPSSFPLFLVVNRSLQGYGHDFGQIFFFSISLITMLQQDICNRQRNMKCQSWNNKRVTELTILCLVNLFKGFVYILNV